MNRNPFKLFLITLGILILLTLPLIIRDRYFQHLLVLSGIFIILTSSWNLLAGYSGLLNLGHAAFFGIGGYSSALFVLKLNLSPWFGLPLGGTIASLFGILLGIPSFRLSGPYLAITTIGFSEILRLVAMNWVSLTRGSLGLYGIPPLTPFNFSADFSIKFASEQNAYYVILIFVFLTLFLLNKLIHSEFGISLKSIREDELGSQSIGIDTSRYKLSVFMISAFLAGFAGSFYAHYVRLISPEMLALGETFGILTMVMVGGLGTLFGPVVGAILLTFLSEGLRFFEDFVKIDIRFVIYGGLLIATILFMRNGIVGLVKGVIKADEKQTEVNG
jgi:branched-chain amino acid transport system permease protein